ncbi:cysteine proteinase [Basidiobolus meristosporus CBS 931.73]|uniref:Ubiquitin carboxyl-terminal hydrolase n=1 Tax=Basidiobolus meristosporus CBS 931.73 TaxID=1314790 RepID=A0A1Y1Z831_9FUNG|nr:cysteine proteinase [Basidiobolus meristosporus CBS 931.73]|eukprot:ORY06429.1 cysteine proteinase [Basidiobolus meristosporus CBS 931.73]
MAPRTPDIVDAYTHVPKQSDSLKVHKKVKSGKSAAGSKHGLIDKNGFRFPTKTIFKKELSQTWGKEFGVGPGLNNLGNTCFMNSVLQCLTYTPPLASYLFNEGHKKTCKVPDFCALCEMEDHVTQCFSGKNTSRGSISPKRIAGKLRSIAKHFRLGRQEDAHEFTRYFLDAMQKSCLHGYDPKLDARIKETTLIHKIFGGYLQSQVKCLSCGYESNTFDPMLDVSLEIRNCPSIEKAFSLFTKPEMLTNDNRYKCEKCNRLVDAQKRMTMYDSPNILTVQLKRFSYGFSLHGGKISKPVSFSETLELKSHMSRTKENSGTSYKLFGVLVHAGGSCHSGHYYSFVKAPNGSWYCMNDCSVEPVSLNTVLKQNAYMLFYAKDQHHSDSHKKSAEKSRAHQMNPDLNGKADHPRSAAPENGDVPSVEPVRSVKTELLDRARERAELKKKEIKHEKSTVFARIADSIISHSKQAISSETSTPTAHNEDKSERQQDEVRVSSPDISDDGSTTSISTSNWVVSDSSANLLNSASSQSNGWIIKSVGQEKGDDSKVQQKKSKKRVHEDPYMSLKSKRSKIAAH